MMTLISWHLRKVAKKLNGVLNFMESLLVRVSYKLVLQALCFLGEPQYASQVSYLLMVVCFFFNLK